MWKGGGGRGAGADIQKDWVDEMFQGEGGRGGLGQDIHRGRWPKCRKEDGGGPDTQSGGRIWYPRRGRAGCGASANRPQRSSTCTRCSAAPDRWRDMVEELLDTGEGGKGRGVLDRGESGRGCEGPKVLPTEAATGVALDPPASAAKNHT